MTSPSVKSNSLEVPKYVTGIVFSALGIFLSFGVFFMSQHATAQKERNKIELKDIQERSAFRLQLQELNSTIILLQELTKLKDESCKVVHDSLKKSITDNKESIEIIEDDIYQNKYDINELKHKIK